MRIPAPTARTVEIRFAPLADRDRFNPSGWRRELLRPSAAQAGFWEIDLDGLSLADDDYEYEFLLDGRESVPIPDPYAEELIRFGGYRGLFKIRGGRHRRPPFSWDDEIPLGMRLPDNNQIVVYELPLRWVSGEGVRQMQLGTFDRAIFERLDELAELGVNAVELLPVQDSADTLNWVYGSRFFFAPDFDMGSPGDLKFFIKRCHQRGIRVLLDLVMNHARECPLEALAYDWFFLRDDGEEPGHDQGWGGRLFRYRRAAYDDYYPAREFHYNVAEFWLREYHVDGFRIDEFKGIDHWEFVQTFRDRATTAFRALFPDRPFLIVAEDSWRRTVITKDAAGNPNRRRVVDAIWNFAYRDEVRRLMRDEVRTRWDAPSRRARIEAVISGRRCWDEWKHSLEEGFDDLAQAVNYLTSHDVEMESEQRFMNYMFGELLRRHGAGDGSVAQVRSLVDRIAEQEPHIKAAHEQALDQVRSGFALLLTSVGIPMFLAGEEFADVHDLDHTDYMLKMSDPVDWSRRHLTSHCILRQAVSELVRLRTTHPALHRNEVEFFYFHPSIDEDIGARVFAYCRSGGQPLGTSGQVVVVANCGPQDFPSFDLPWPWPGARQISEYSAPSGGGRPYHSADGACLTLKLSPFQVRVFTT